MPPTLALSLLLAIPETLGLLPPPPAVRYLTVAWVRALAPADLLDWEVEEEGGPAVDPASRTVVCGVRGGALRAFREDGGELWEFQAGAGFAVPPLVREGVVYAGSLDGRLYAIELATGRERWRYEAGEEMGSTPLFANGLLVVATFQDSVIAVEADSGVWRWHHRRDQREGFTIRGAARPVLAHGNVYAGYSDGYVAALDPATGVVRWERKVAPSGDYTDVDGLAADARAIYAAAYSGAILGLDPKTGKTLWEQKAPGAARVLAADGLVYGVTTAGVLALSPADGSVRWKRELRGVPAGAPARVGKRLLVPGAKGLAVIDPTTGKLLRVFDPGTGISAPIADAGRRVYVLSNGGSLQALDISE